MAAEPLSRQRGLRGGFAHVPTGPRLRVHVRAKGVDETLILPLAEVLSIGRDADCDVVLPSSDVSRKHASLLLRAGELWVRDHSTHGTNVDGARLHVATRAVGRGTDLVIGPYTLALQLEGDDLGAKRSSTLPLEEPAPADAAPVAVEVSTARPSHEPSLVDVALRLRIRSALLESLDLVSLERDRMDAASLRPRVLEALERIVARLLPETTSAEQRARLIDELCDEALGLGPLEPLLADPSISEIMVVDPATIYVERAGRLELIAQRFTDDVAVRAVLERIVTPLGRRIDESSPLVDARLPDGSRVHAVIPPLAIKGPCITIRKFPKGALTLERLVELGALSDQMARFLSRAVRVRTNVVIAGGTGSGKTTLLNALSASIAAHERVVTIEDAAELRLPQRHVVSLESRPPNMEGAGAVTIRDLVRNALRMRPDRIVVGECRGGEALDMLQAMNTGHEGSMTTTHANSPREAVQRLETLCLMAGLDLPMAAIRQQITSSIDLLVQQSRFADGSRRITHVTEVVGVDDDGEVELRDIFRYTHEGTDAQGRVLGSFAPTGQIPSFVSRFLAHGLVEEGAWF